MPIGLFRSIKSKRLGSFVRICVFFSNHHCGGPNVHELPVAITQWNIYAIQ